LDDQRRLVLDKIAEVFPHLDAEDLMGRFEALKSPEKYRVALAILKLSEEDGKDSPDDFIEAARRDYRDVLMWAEYPNEMKLDSWKEPTSKVKEMRAKDRKQYLDWLNKGRG
jgi:hypothetical protein